MSWFIQHKFVTLFLLAGIFYWIKNPSHEFGYVRENLVVYNKIPLFKIDCYVAPNGKLSLEGDLSQPGNITYWLENHLNKTADPGANGILLVGSGFTGKKIAFTNDQMKLLKDKSLKVVMLPSQEAIARFNELKKAGKPAGILLKVY